MRILIIYKKEELKEAEDMKNNFEKISKFAKKENKWKFEIQEEKENGEANNNKESGIQEAGSQLP